MWASVEGYTEIVRVLLSKEADLTPKDNNFNRDALQWAISNGHNEISNLIRKALS